jgi:hypothetical protein
MHILPNRNHFNGGEGVGSGGGGGEGGGGRRDDGVDTQTNLEKQKKTF